MDQYKKITAVLFNILVPASALFLSFSNAHADFLNDLTNNLRNMQSVMPTPPSATALNNTQHPQAHNGNGQISYQGYSKEYLPIKNLIASGQLEQAQQLQQQRIKADDINFLDSIEAAILAIDAQNNVAAIDNFAAAENYLKLLSDRSIIEGSFIEFGSEALTFISGVGDLTEYNGEPYERILMLNYKSIAYLLNGERKAYNVTRRAIDWQNIEKKEFESNLQDVKENNQKQEFKDAENSTLGANAFDTILKQYKVSETKALSVSSAYINPFGFYMAGIVQEFDSYEDKSLRDNARISYQKALKLNPDSKVIKLAIKSVKKAPPRRRRLVQIIAADGFAPEKKTLTINMNIAGGLVPIKLPLFEPVNSQVAKIKIKYGRKTLATLSPIADIEAITLRHQMDSLPMEHAKVVTSIIRNIAENQLWNKIGFFGAVGKQIRESFANPDMRAWMSLPKTFSAARFYVSSRVKKIKIISYDKKNRKLAEQTVELTKKSHNFIYVRSIDKTLYTSVAKKLWVKAK